MVKRNVLQPEQRGKLAEEENIQIPHADFKNSSGEQQLERGGFSVTNLDTWIKLKYILSTKLVPVYFYPVPS